MLLSSYTSSKNESHYFIKMLLLSYIMRSRYFMRFRKNQICTNYTNLDLENKINDIVWKHDGYQLLSNFILRLVAYNYK